MRLGTTPAPGTGRLAYAVASRQAGGVVRPSLTIRIIALAVVLTVLIQPENLVAIALCLPAVAICMVRVHTLLPAPSPAGAGRVAALAQPIGIHGPNPAGRSARTDLGAAGVAAGGERLSSDIRRRRWIAVTWCDVLSALLVVGVAARATAGLPASSRFLALGAAAVLVAVVSVHLCLDPRWYRPDRRPRRLSRRLRALAGPLGMAACQLLALTAPWAPGEPTIVVLLTLLPLANVAMTVDQDQTLRFLVEMVRTEAQDGRQSVLDELHGTLSANLRLLEQSCGDLRSTSPRLYELAVGANSRLRETLTLADPQRDDARAPSSLVALVQTLTMAVGAQGELDVRVDRLAESDRDLVRLALNDLLRVLLADGVGRLRAWVELSGGELRVVVDANRPICDEVLDRLAPLRHRLGVLGAASDDGDGAAGVVRLSAHRRLMARWPASVGTR